MTFLNISTKWKPKWTKFTKIWTNNVFKPFNFYLSSSILYRGFSYAKTPFTLRVAK